MSYARTRMHPRSRISTLVALVAAMHATALSAPGLAFAEARPRGAATAQPLPKDLIQRGQRLFDDQQYEESIQMLSAALVRPGNTKEQRIEIHRLLALNYITLGRREEAEGAVRGLLSLSPGYELPPRESPRFRERFAEVRAKWEAEGRPGLVKETEPPPAPVTMQHSSPSQIEAGAELVLLARLDDPGKRAAEVKLYFRSGSRGRFTEQVASRDGASVRATIPPSAVKPPLVEYYFEGRDKAGLPVVSRGDSTAPLRVAVPEPSKPWLLPVAIGGGVLGVAAIVGGLALAGVFKRSSGSPPGPGGGTPPVGTTNPQPGPGTSRVVVSIGE